MITKEKALDLARGILTKAKSRFKQDFIGENEEVLDRTLRKYRADVARHTWHVSQKWCKWDSEGPVLMPDYTRIYYRKGETEVVVQEYPPQIRLLKFNSSLANKTHSDDPEEIGNRILNYSLALPYVVFMFKFCNGLFREVKCAFSDRPLKRLEEVPLRPYFGNMDSNLNVCLGRGIDSTQFIQGQLTQQIAMILDHFWQSAYSDEWSAHYWANKSHFQRTDPRLKDLESWQEASFENPLFVVEDVKWLPLTDHNFGDMIVRMFQDDSVDAKLQEELYRELVDGFLEEMKKTVEGNLTTVSNKITDAEVEALAQELLENLK